MRGYGLTSLMVCIDDKIYDRSLTVLLLDLHLPCLCVFHQSCSSAKSSLPAFSYQPVRLSKMGCLCKYVWRRIFVSSMLWSIVRPGLSIGRSYSIGWLDPRSLSNILRLRVNVLANLHGDFHDVKRMCDASDLLS